MTTADTSRNEPIQIARDSVVTMQHVTFSLRQDQFLRLTKIYSFVAIWAHTFFAGTGLFLVTIAARLIDKHAFGGTSSVGAVDWITLGILCVLVLALEGINYCLPSEKKKMEKIIQDYFDTHENT